MATSDVQQQCLHAPNICAMCIPFQAEKTFFIGKKRNVRKFCLF